MNSLRYRLQLHSNRTHLIFHTKWINSYVMYNNSTNKMLPSHKQIYNWKKNNQNSLINIQRDSPLHSHSLPTKYLIVCYRSQKVWSDPNSNLSTKAKSVQWNEKKNYLNYLPCINLNFTFINTQFFFSAWIRTAKAPTRALSAKRSINRPLKHSDTLHQTCMTYEFLVKFFSYAKKK